MRITLRVCLGLVCAASVVFNAKAQQRPVSIEDCIEMVRIQQTYDPNDPTVVFSPDGRQFVTMIWRGNLKTNLNEYTLLLYDAEHLDLPAKELLKVRFGYEQPDQHARPLKQFAFLSNNRLAALATFDGKPRQVVSIDLGTKRVTRLTNHPTAVLSFAATRDGKSIVYAADPSFHNARKTALFRDGFSLEDREAIDPMSLGWIAGGNWFNPTAEFFLIKNAGAPPQKLYKAPLAVRWTFSMAPDGRHAVAYPYMPTSGKQTVGLIDMSTGKIEPLAADEALSVVAWMQWFPNSKSVLVFATPARQPAILSEITLASRKVTSVNVGQYREWEPMGLHASGNNVILSRPGRARSGDPERTLATLRRSPTGWEGPNSLAKTDSKFDLNARYYSSTNGQLIVGVKDNLSEPPELAAYNLETKRTVVLTNLNPQLRELKMGKITRIRWSGPYDKETSFGYLIKPVGYEAGKKYPLIIQLKDEGYYPEDNSFIIDGTEQLSGAAIQVWANAGFMVLFTPSPSSVREVIESPQEDERITAHIETALDMLESQGLIDRRRVAITGWSRAGWYTEVILSQAKTRFAAAATLDNVSYNLNQYLLSVLGPFSEGYKRHWGGVQPWGDTAEQWRQRAIDLQYDKSQTPRLIEVHGTSSVAYHAEAYTALKTAKIPVEFYLYPDAPHNLKSPIHRYNSLSTHTDWFRFWLQDYEDPSPKKRTQYARWRKMRAEWEAAKREQQQKGKQ